MRTSLEALDLALAGLALGSIGASFMLQWAVRRKLSARPAADSGYRPRISVLKPLCGVDEGLYENLVSFAEQDYPDYELVIGVADARDPALVIVQRLRAAYPALELKVVVHGEHDPLANPKVISLTHMAHVARHDYLLVSDSNVRATPDYLARIAAEMSDPAVGLVSNLIVGAGEASVGAHCENLHLNTFVIGGVCIADLADTPCVVGKSMLMRRRELEALGGFASLRNVLAEDYLLGQRYHAAGYRVVLSQHTVATHNQRLSMRRFLSRHLRWAQLRRVCAIGPFCSEPLLYSSPWIVAPLLASEAGTVELLAPACSLALAAHLASAGLIARRACGRWPAARSLLLLPLKDTLLLGVWTVALLRRSVEWRGHRLRIEAGSRLVTLPARSSLRELTVRRSARLRQYIAAKRGALRAA
jgi:ceramide glucosyltransferase